MSRGGKIFGKGDGEQGKMVLVSAGLSGVGSIAAQMAKNVYGAKKVITTVSTPKIPLVEKYLGEGVVDKVIDYTKTKPVKAIQHRSVDVMIDSVGGWFSILPLMKPKGTIISCAGAPFSGNDLLNITPTPTTLTPLLAILLNLLHTLVRFYITLFTENVQYDTVLMKANGFELESVRKWVEEGKIRAVVGKVVMFRDLEGLRGVCEGIARGKGGGGGVGKVVVVVVGE